MNLATKTSRLHMAIAALIVTSICPALAGSYAFSPIDYPQVLDTVATGINDSGQITGSYYNGKRDQGFLYTPGSGFSMLASPPGAASADPRGINNAGQIVGDYSDTTERHGFLYTPGSGFTIFTGVYAAVALGINNLGQVAGDYLASNGSSQAFLYTPGAGTTFFNDPAANSDGTTVTGINDAGQVIGDVNGNGFLYTPGAGFTTLQDPEATSGTFVNGINDEGQIVGYYAENSVDHGFLYTPGTGFVTIDDPVAGTLDNAAAGISNFGQIVGDYGEFNTGTHGFVATPAAVPEASTTVSLGLLLALGIIGLTVAARRKTVEIAR